MQSNYQNLSPIEKSMCERYKELKNNSGIDADFVKKGISFCYGNPSQGILLTGINPSRGNDDCFFRYKDAIKDAIGPFWRKKKEQISGSNELLMSCTAYLDLFPYYESDQIKFLKILKDYPEFQAKVLEITLENIEKYIRPRLIIAANKEAGFYWGHGKSTWLGYDLIKLGESENPSCLKHKEIQLFYVNGFRKANDRVGQDKYSESRITGSYFIQYAMYNELHSKYKETRWLNPQLVEDIYKWVMEQPMHNYGR
jgi:hypothetical protein